MTPDELEARSKSELIALVEEQRRQIAELQTQIAQLRLLASTRNGDDQDASTLAAAPAGRFPLAFKIILIAAGLFACGVVLIIANFRPGIRVGVGFAQDYAPGSATALQLPDPARAGASIPVLLVNEPGGGFLALHNRDPGSGCLVSWDPATQRIEDPCGGSKYTQTGAYLSGPSPRSLDRFPVAIGENGEITVDIGTLQAGPPRP